MPKVNELKSIALIFPYLSRYWKSYSLGFILLVAINSLGAYIPQLIKQAIDFLQELELDGELNKLVITILIMALVMAIVRTASRRIIFGIGREVEYDLKKDLFNHLVKMQPAYFTKQKTGDLISTLTNDVQSLRGLAGFGMLNILNTSIAFSIIIPLMFNLNFKLTLAFLSIIPLVLLLVTLVSARLKHYQQLVLDKLGSLSNFIEQNLSGIHIVKAYSQEEAELRRFNAVNKDLLGDYLNLIKYRSVIGPTMKLIASIGLVLILYIGGQAIINETFSLGEFAAYSLYIERLIWPVSTLGWLVTVFYRANISIERIHGILSTEATIKNTEKALEKNSFNDEIYLTELDTKILKGQKIGVVGTIGSGKSTLAKKLMHLIELNDGEILIDGTNLRDIKLESLRSMINMVPQESFLFSTSIKENIAYAKDLSDDEIVKLAKTVSIHDEIMKLPKGYDTMVGERGVTLSGGQRQRIAIARALSIDPDILILDDALSSVDNETASSINENIHKLRTGKTSIIITHKIHTVKDADKILVLDKMRLFEEGKHEELIKNTNGLYKNLWDTAQEASHE